MNIIILEGYFDGSVKDNKAIYTWIYYIYEKKKGNPKTLLKTESGWDYCFNVIAYEAEYMGLITLLDNIKKYNDKYLIKRILIKGDCKSLFTTINPDRYKISKFNEYILLARKLKDEIELKFSIPVKLNWVPRENNRPADSLCKLVWRRLSKNRYGKIHAFTDNSQEKFKEFAIYF